MDLLQVIVADDGRTSFARLSAGMGLATSTAHRMARALERRGFILRAEAGRYVGGPALITMAHGIDEPRLLTRVSRPVLTILSRKLRRTAHLGVLEDGMVTYLAKVAHGPAAAFTREDMQLEAYCSGIGKVLLARLSAAEREAYLGEGPFVALTANTIVDPVELAEHLNQVRAQNYARDDAEVFEDLRCVAVPILRADGSAAAAISISTTGPESDAVREGQALAALQGAAAVIETKMSFAKAERTASFVP